ncbi:hypothetical protein AHF37_10351, partial [Paragonimus kellicotti]
MCLYPVQTQLEILANSFEAFTEHALILLPQCRVVFSPEHPESLTHLESLLSCLQELHQSRLFQFCFPFHNSLQSEVITAIKKRACNNYEVFKSNRSIYEK